MTYLKDNTQNIDTLKRINQSLQGRIDLLSHQLVSKTQKTQNFNTEQIAELIFENSTAVLFRRLAAVDPKKRKMVYVSPNISRFGYRAKDFIEGRIMFRDIVYEGDSERTLKEISEFVNDGIEEYSQIYRIVTGDGELRWIEDRTSIFDEKSTGLRYHQGLVIDIHEQKIAEEKVRKSEEKYRRIVETAGEGFLLMDDSFRIIDLNSAYAQIVNSSPSDIIGHCPLSMEPDDFQRLWSTGKITEVSENCEFECEIDINNNHKLSLLIHGNTLRSDTGDIIGNMAFITDITYQKKALQLAAEVQKSLLPEAAPSIDGLDIAGRSIPCDEVGGDYFDYISGTMTQKDNVSVIVGDITGHGVDSALLMASARAFLRMRASQPGTIKDIVMDMNKHLTGDMAKSGRFMTLFYLCINRRDNTLDWVRAGHDPALLYSPTTDQFKELKGPGLALGVDKDYIYEEQQFAELADNQILLLSTDGISEGCNRECKMFGKERLKNIVRQNSTKSAETILNQILQEHSRFTQGTVKEDDITLVVVKFV